MKKLLFIFLIPIITIDLLGISLSASAATVPTKKVTTPVVKKKVAVKKPANKVTMATVKSKISVVNGVVTSVDYDAKTFTIKAGGITYAVTTTSKTNVVVPGVRRGTSVYNLGTDMDVKVAGVVNKDTATIAATTITLIYTHIK